MAVRRTYLQMAQDAKERISKNTPANNFNSQSTVKALSDVALREIEEHNLLAEELKTILDPTENNGENLDKIGFLVGKSRDSAVTASDYSDTNFYFYINPLLNTNIKNLIKDHYTYEERLVLEENGYITTTNGEPDSLIIPDGSIVQNTDGSIVYKLINSVSLTGNNDSYVGIIATGVGPSYNVESNVLVSHVLHTIPELRKVAQFIKCSNRYPIQNGKYSMTDEEYRYAISTTTAGSNELSVRSAALSMPGVRDILFQRNKFGSGTASIIIDGISPLISQGLIDAVEERVRFESGDKIYVNAPEYLGVEIKISIIPRAGESDVNSLRNLAKDTIIQYVNDREIGGEIIWNQIITNVLSIDGIIDVIPDYFKIGEYDPFKKINNKQKVLRFINHKAKYDQRFYTDMGLITCCSND